VIVTSCHLVHLVSSHKEKRCCESRRGGALLRCAALISPRCGSMASGGAVDGGSHETNMLGERGHPRACHLAMVRQPTPDRETMEIS